MRANFDELRPEERRLILVASDAKYSALCNQLDWKAIGKAVFFATNPLLGIIGSGVASSSYLAATSAWAGARHGGVTFSLINPFKIREIPIPHLSPVEAAQRFQFDLGVAEDGAAYILNPCRPNYYLRPSSANERLAQEKLSAFIQLSSALGAKEITVGSGECVEKSAKGKGKVPLPDSATQIGLQVSFSSESEVQRTAVAKFGKPRTAPHVPDEFRAWLGVDPILDGLARTRLRGSVEELGVALTFRDEIDVGAKACAELAGKGLSIGLDYRAVHASRWAFTITFWPSE